MRVKIAVFMLSVLLVLAVSCGDLKKFPLAVLENADGSPEDLSDYNFEANNHGFTTSTPSSNNFAFRVPMEEFGIVNNEISSDRSYKGSKSLKIHMCTFPNEPEEEYYTKDIMFGGLVQIAEASPQDFSGKKITAYVWIPRGLFSATPGAPYGASFFVKADYMGDSFKWFQGEWVNLQLSSAAAEGMWNKIEVYVDQMTLDDEITPIGASAQAVNEWGIKVSKGDNSSDFKGYIYIDSISITDAD